MRSHHVIRSAALLAGAISVATVGAACSSAGGEANGQTSEAANAAAPLASIARGRDIWLKSTFGGEKFFSLYLPMPPFSLALGFDAVLTTPRAQRFTTWGVVNDPDCTDGDASTGGLDRCPDPSATGIVGIRKGPDPTHQRPFLVGVSCAGCHAGLDAQNPPADPNRPSWGNIHLTTGNQFIQIGKIFGAKLSSHDPRKQVFQTWAPGTVDTTAIESDGINNPGIITQFYKFDERPYFDNHFQGLLENDHRAGQAGEDDVGCQKAALRVYFNIGMCAAECMIPHLANGPGGTQTPIDDAECSARCADYVQAKADVVDECAFINDTHSTPSPKLEDAPGGASHVDAGVVDRGHDVFESACASCHGNGQNFGHDDFSDDKMHLASGFNPLFGEAPGSIGTNKCRSLSTNWSSGHIWQNFASDELHTQKSEIAQGRSYYRDVPLLGIWATAPFFHNNRLGTYSGDPSVGGRVAAYENAMHLLLNPWERDFGGSVQVTSDSIQVPTPFGPVTLPAGTPVAAFANLNPKNPLQNLCPEYVENGGHYYGALLTPEDKHALTEFVKTL
jgi:hypothetical protein